MLRIVANTLDNLRAHGLRYTIRKVIQFTKDQIKAKIIAKKVFSLDSIEDRFTVIYTENYWSDKESASGRGSTLLYTQNLRNCLPEVLEKYKISSVFDAPCGDFNWMKHFVSEHPIAYMGGDIVKPLIESHLSKYKNASTDFVHVDLTRDDLPRTDLMICRDCLFHLSFQDTLSVLKNFVRSGTPYLLTTSHLLGPEHKNYDIATGDYRLMNLFAQPYHFPQDYLAKIDDWLAPDSPRAMFLWSRGQIEGVIAKFKSGK